VECTDERILIENYAEISRSTTSYYDILTLEAAERHGGALTPRSKRALDQRRPGPERLQLSVEGFFSSFESVGAAARASL
jgi:hypothetical protein